MITEEIHNKKGVMKVKINEEDAQTQWPTS